MKTTLLAIKLAMFCSVVDVTFCLGQSSDVPSKFDFSDRPESKRSYTNGVEAAKRNLAAGILTIKSYGLPAAWVTEYDRLVERKCNAKVDRVAGCAVDFKLVEFVRGYNGVTKKLIEQRHGTNVWRELQKEASEAWNRSYTETPTRSPKADEYRVHAGDTLSRIALEHSVTLKSLIEANPRIEPTRLKIGQVIQIPARSKP